MMRNGIAALAVGTVLTLAAPSAEAAFVLTLYDGTTYVQAGDGSVLDTNAATGVITINATIGEWLVNVTTGISKPVFPSSDGYAQMDLNSVNVSSAGTGDSQLWIWLTDTSFNTTLPGTLYADVGGTTQGTASFWACKDDANGNQTRPTSATGFTTPCNGSSPIAVNLGPFSGGAFSGSGADPHDPLGLYSMTLGAYIFHGGGVRSTSFDFQVINSVPEPATMALLGLGLIGAGAYGRRRRQ